MPKTNKQVNAITHDHLTTATAGALVNTPTTQSESAASNVRPQNSHTLDTESGFLYTYTLQL